MARNHIVLSVPTSGNGATAAATYSFFTSGYRPPRQSRSISRDVVHNQNGVFTYVYDNGPGVHQWDTFEIRIQDAFTNEVGSATVQLQRLEFLWRYNEGPMGLRAPEGVYQVGWSDQPMEKYFFDYPADTGSPDAFQFRIPIALEES